MKIRFGRGGVAHHGTPLALLVVPALAAGAIFEFGAYWLWMTASGIQRGMKTRFKE